MQDALDSAYHHRAKTARPGTILCGAGVTLKWYDLEEPGLPVSPDIHDLARAACARLTEGTAAQHGFAITHRCGTSFHFLLINLWLGNNELWQAVHYLDTGLDDFAPFPPAYPAAGAPRPTFCVWELGIVAHEALAWQRLLFSARSPAAFNLWQADTFHGPV